MRARFETSQLRLTTRGAVLLALFALLGALFVVASPQPSAAANGPIQMGPEDGACTTFFFNYIPHPEGEQEGTATDFYRYCTTPAQGAGPGDVSRQDTIDHDVEELSALLLHISCSDPFDVPVMDNGQIVGFVSDQGSDLDGWMIAPRDNDDGPVADFAILRKTGSAGFRDCGNFPLPEDPEPDPDTASVAVVKTVDGDDLAEGDPIFSFTLFADDDGSWVEVSTETTAGDVEWDDRLLGDYLLCETDVPDGFTTVWPDDERFTETTHDDDSCVSFELLLDDDPLTVNVDNETDDDPVIQATQVCVLATGELATIDEDDFDGALHGAVDDEACVDEGVAPLILEEEEGEEEPVEEAVLPTAVEAGTGGLADSGIPALVLALMALGALMLARGAVAVRRVR